MAIVIGHIALIQRSKKQDFVLNVLSQLKEAGLDVIGLFAGEAREPDFLQELQAKTDQKGLHSNVLFLGRRNDIPALLKVLDVLIIPSSFEGFPLAGLEAAAAGVPVAACNAAGAEEFVRVSGNGVVFQENDTASAVEAIKTILKNRESFQRAGVRFSRAMSTQKYAERIKSVFLAIS